RTRRRGPRHGDRSGLRRRYAEAPRARFRPAASQAAAEPGAAPVCRPAAGHLPGRAARRPDRAGARVRDGRCPAARARPAAAAGVRRRRPRRPRLPQVADPAADPVIIKELYAARLTHGPVELAFTDRHGGVSGAPFDSLNLGWAGGDDPEAMAENHRLVMDDFAPGDGVERLGGAGRGARE